ncbi:MAG: DEAD/DEAH box helicase [Bacteroidales bacterium]|nr:DEAD/DEAH box helicase [Bacteroidales bacterium]
MKREPAQKKTIKKEAKTIPYHHRPENLPLEAWQIGLRKQFVQDRVFGITKLDGHPVFSDYLVYNPETKNTYKVAIRSADNTLNFCSCLDFKTNHLGTCKHIEAILKQIHANKRASAILDKGYLPPYTSVYLNYAAQRTVKLRIGTEASEKYKALASHYFDKDLALLPEACAHFEHFLALARAIHPDFRCYEDALEFVLEHREKERLTRQISERYPTGEELQGLLQTRFFKYQQEGILFAIKAGRCIIADEMGLGKTIQAIAAAELLKIEAGISRVLIVCPTSLKYQWQSEIGKFTTDQALVIEGNPHFRENQYQSDSFYKIVSYHTVGNDLELINRREFDLVILDEAQRIKNWKTKVAQNVKKIRSPHAIVLTGTPLENKLEDLYSIIQFVDPFKLGPYYWFLDRYQVKNPTGKVTGYRHLHEISQKLKGIMVRRTKQEVLTQLPERMDKTLFVPMTEKQMEYHSEFSDAVARLVNKWKKLGFLNEQDRQRLMINLNLMRMVCDSTYIIDQQTRHDTKVDELMNILSEFTDDPEGKVVVFSQWERMTRLVARELEQRELGYEYLHGGVPSKKRKQLFDHFNQDPECRVFLSTDAGSTGLNLQSASLVINLDIPWNPAVLEQRIARVHRLGQKKNVSVIHFVASGTIEHRMLGVLKFKSSLAQGVLDNGEDSIFMSEDRFREFMKSVEELTASTDQLQEVILPAEEEQETVELLFAESEEQPEKPISGIDRMLPGDDDVVPVESVPADSLQDKPADLISTGIAFFSGLTRTLSSPEATEKLVHSLVEKDKDSGKTYLKIPVESEKTITDILTLFGQLLKK